MSLDDLLRSAEGHRQRLDAAVERNRQVRQRMARLHTAGNAGGVVATLAFVGTLVGRGVAVPAPVFWLTVVFLIGLFFSMLTVSAEVLESWHEHKELESGQRGFEPHHSKAKSARRSMLICSAIAATILIAGVAWGLVLLYGLTGASLTPAPAS